MDAEQMDAEMDAEEMDVEEMDAEPMLRLICVRENDRLVRLKKLRGLGCALRHCVSPLTRRFALPNTDILNV